MKEARFYTKLINKSVRCDLCPHYCIIDDGKRGKCSVRKNLNGILYATSYNKTISLSIDPIEKKPLYHFNPGGEILSIGHNSCNFKCQFCQNFEISINKSSSYDLSIEDLIKTCRLKNIKMVAFTYTEPSTWFEYVLDCCKSLKDNGIQSVLVTNGFINEKPLLELLPYISAMNIDLKSMNDKFYREICDGNLKSVLQTITLSQKFSHIEITNLVIPSYNDSENEIENLIDFVSNISKRIPIHFSKYFPRYKLQAKETPTKTLLKIFEMAEKKLDFVYLGNINSQIGQNTYCPNCKKILIERNGYQTQIRNISDGKCQSCGTKIYGVWEFD